MGGRMEAAPRVCWLLQGLPDLPEADDWLSEAERIRLDAFRFPKRRNDWRLGRWTAKRLVSAFVDMQPSIGNLASVEIRAARDGAPEAYVRGVPVHFSLSISHSANFGLCAAGSDGIIIGCDIELVQEHEPNFAADYFAREENVLLSSFPGHPFATTLIWSAKESSLKVLREGLRRDTRGVVIELDPDRRCGGWNPFVGCCRESSQTFPGWWQVRDRLIMTVAASRPFDLPARMIELVRVGG